MFEFSKIWLLLFLSISLLSCSKKDELNSTSNLNNSEPCSSARDYDIGLKNGLRMAPPCDITTSKLPKCLGEYSVVTWTACYGERSIPNAGTYKGEYLEGKANGKGEFVNQDSTRYLGEYSKGLRNGYGKEYSSNGTILNEGQWINGNLAVNSQSEITKEVTLSTNTSSLTFDSNESNAKFNIPAGSTYICKNKKASDMLLQLVYSRTSPELASIIVNAPTQRIDQVITWLHFVPSQVGSANEYSYRNTKISTTILTIYPRSSMVVISGNDASLEFQNCLMINK